MLRGETPGFDSGMTSLSNSNCALVRLLGYALVIWLTAVIGVSESQNDVEQFPTVIDDVISILHSQIENRSSKSYFVSWDRSRYSGLVIIKNVIADSNNTSSSK